jgi:hypothetical protein
MTTPLENLEPGCYVVIELRNFQVDPTTIPAPVEEKAKSGFSSFFGGGSKDTKNEPPVSQGQLIAWHIFPIDLSVINSGPQTMEFFQPPVAYPALPGQPGSNAGSSLVSDLTFLETDILISKRSKAVDLQEYAAQPQWANLYMNHQQNNNNNVIEAGTKDDTSRSTESATYFHIGKFLGLNALQPRYVKETSTAAIAQVEDADPRAGKISEDDINSMSLKDLKNYLEYYKVDYSMLLEKSDFRMALKFEKSNRNLLI